MYKYFDINHINYTAAGSEGKEAQNTSLSMENVLKFQFSYFFCCKMFWFPFLVVVLVDDAVAAAALIKTATTNLKFNKS